MSSMHAGWTHDVIEMNRILRWIRNNPALFLLLTFIIVQTAANVTLALRINELQLALRELVLKLYPPYPTYSM